MYSAGFNTILRYKNELCTFCWNNIIYPNHTVGKPNVEEGGGFGILFQKQKLQNGQGQGRSEQQQWRNYIIIWLIYQTKCFNWNESPNTKFICPWALQVPIIPDDPPTPILKVWIEEWVWGAAYLECILILFMATWSRALDWER